MRLNQMPTWVLDAIGLSLVIGVIAVAGWLGFGRSGEARARTTLANSRIADAKRAIAAVATKRDAQEHRLAEHASAIASLGVTNLQIAPEIYFQDMAALAAEHDLLVISHRPVADRAYPGLREQQYAYDVSGTTLDVWRFLSAIEQMDAWADVSYLRIDAGSGGGVLDAGDRLATLTISVFSIPSEQQQPDAEGGARD